MFYDINQNLGYKKMNVLLIHEYINIQGGADAHVRYLESELSNYGINTFLLAIRKEGKQYKIEIYGELKPYFLTFLVEAYNFVLNICYQKNINIIHVHTHKEPRLLKRLSTKIPIVRTLHNAALTCLSGEKFHFKSGKTCNCQLSLKCLVNAYTERCASTRHPQNLLKIYEKINFEKNNAEDIYEYIISPSQFIKNECTNHGVNLVEVIPYPYSSSIDILHIENLEQVNIVYSGRLTFVKGVQLLPKIFSEILKKNSNVHLHIAGDGPLQDKLKKEFKDMNFDNVTFYGWMNQVEIQKIYSKADIVIIPSIYPDNFPIVCIESLCFSKPVVIFRVGGLPEMVIDGYNGFVIEPYDIQKMQEKVVELIFNLELRKTMGSNSRKVYEEKFEPKVVIPQYVKIYKKAMEKHSQKLSLQNV